MAYDEDLADRIRELVLTKWVDVGVGYARSLSPKNAKRR